jgi:hypothetical protein
MRRVSLLLVALLTAATLAGCGSSRFHSATRVYSVQQVDASFAAHGITLHEVEPHPSQVVALSSSFGSHFPISVYVAPTVRLADPFRMFPSLKYSLGPIIERKHGNVVLVFRLGVPTGPIDAALADLR